MLNELLISLPSTHYGGRLEYKITVIQFTPFYCYSQIISPAASKTHELRTNDTSTEGNGAHKDINKW